MEIILWIIYLIFGLFLLIKGADALIEGSVFVAQKFKISQIIIGLTIVSLGTSTPEFIISISSALNGYTDLALANVVGSNIINILLILGLSAIIYPVSIKRNTASKEIPMMLLASIMVLVLSITNQIDDKSIFSINLWDNQNVLGYIGLSSGLVLISFFIIFLYYIFSSTKNNPNIQNTDLDVKQQSTLKTSLLIILGAIALALGGDLVVENSIKIGYSLGFSQKLIGLTVVSLGTSLPELVTTIIAAFKKNSDIVITNVIGSNIFNILFILATTAMFKQIPIYGQNVLDILILIFVSLFLFISIFVFKKYTIGKIEGFCMLLLYAIYFAFLILQG